MTTTGSQPADPFPDPLQARSSLRSSAQTESSDLGAILVTAERSVSGLARRLRDLANHTTLVPGHVAEAISSDVIVTMQVVDLTYRRLSVAYFEAVGPDDEPVGA